jgi:hypothetical protein
VSRPFERASSGVDAGALETKRVSPSPSVRLRRTEQLEWPPHYTRVPCLRALPPFFLILLPFLFPFRSLPANRIMPTAPSLFEQLNAALASGEAEDAIKGVKVRRKNEKDGGIANEPSTTNDGHRPMQLRRVLLPRTVSPASSSSVTSSDRMATSQCTEGPEKREPDAPEEPERERKSLRGIDLDLDLSIFPPPRPPSHHPRSRSKPQKTNLTLPKGPHRIRHRRHQVGPRAPPRQGEKGHERGPGRQAGRDARDR